MILVFDAIGDFVVDTVIAAVCDGFLFTVAVFDRVRDLESMTAMVRGLMADPMAKLSVEEAGVSDGETIANGTH